MLDDARERSKQVPGSKYDIKHSQTAARSLTGAQLYPRQRVPGQQIKGSRAGGQAHIIKKAKTGACVGSYEEQKAITKT